MPLSLLELALILALIVLPVGLILTEPQAWTLTKFSLPPLYLEIIGLDCFYLISLISHTLALINNKTDQ